MQTNRIVFFVKQIIHLRFWKKIQVLTPLHFLLIFKVFFKSFITSLLDITKHTTKHYFTGVILLFYILVFNLKLVKVLKTLLILRLKWHLLLQNGIFKSETVYLEIRRSQRVLKLQTDLALTGRYISFCNMQYAYVKIDNTFCTE